MQAQRYPIFIKFPLTTRCQIDQKAIREAHRNRKFNEVTSESIGLDPSVVFGTTSRSKTFQHSLKMELEFTKNQRTTQSTNRSQF